jgi:alpha-N-acetylglucosaminidase
MRGHNMRWIFRTVYFLSLLIVVFEINNVYAQSKVVKSDFDKRPVYDLIKRILPKDYKYFVVEYIKKEENKDTYEIESKSGKIYLRGNDGIAAASALNHYLKNYAHCGINWNVSKIVLQHPLPLIPQKIRKISPYQYRYYLNYCTFNYTMSWWNWERWQKEIDFMALNGINMPLAILGQNSIWNRVYNSMGFTVKQLEKFFPGPAYFSWFWMGNLDGYGGPLPINWMKSHEELQKKILRRERELGMTVVLPAFTGHVPPDFKDKFPQTKLIKTIWDDDEFGPVYSIDPADTMFTFIGKKYLKEQTKIYGTDHFYSSDTFNENKPPSNDTTFLSNISKKVYSSMWQVDSSAVWVMQGWMFAVDNKFWRPPQIKALLSAVPNDKMIILDLWSEHRPVWDKTEAYYGKGWIWCMLHNFGGKLGLFGDIETIANSPVKTRFNTKSGKMIGIGITAEGIEQNPAIYSLMLDNVWRTDTIKTLDWLIDYSYARYGKKNKNAEEAWKILHRTVYNENSIGSPETIIALRPELNKGTGKLFSALKLPYSPKDLLTAWDYFISAASELKNNEGFKYDLVDLSRQVLSNYSNELYKKMMGAFKEKNIKKVKDLGDKLLTVADDLDILLNSRDEFLLGKWINDAKKWGENQNEKKLYEKNAKDLVTLWGNKNSILHEYARKQWAGLIKDFYKPRWEKFIQILISCLENNTEFNQNSYDTMIKDWEWGWVNGNKSYRDKSYGNPIEITKLLHKKYFNEIKDIE